MRPGELFNPYKMFTGVFIPTAVVRWTEISAGAKIAYGRLCQFAGENGQCYPSWATLGRELGASRDQTRRYMRELRAARLIQVTPRQTQHGDADSSLVEFVWHSIFESEGVGADMPGGRCRYAPTVGADLHRGVGADMHPKESHCKRVKEESNTLSPAASEKATADPLKEKQTEWFSSFWDLYWRRIGRKAAEKAFRQVVKTEEAWDAIRDAIEKQTPAMMAREPQYRPHAATWINQQRWTDEPEAPCTAVAVRGQFMTTSERNAILRDQMFEQLMSERFRDGEIH